MAATRCSLASSPRGREPSLKSKALFPNRATCPGSEALGSGGQSSTYHKSHTLWRVHSGLGRLWSQGHRKSGSADPKRGRGWALEEQEECWLPAAGDLGRPVGRFVLGHDHHLWRRLGLSSLQGGWGGLEADRGHKQRHLLSVLRSHRVFLCFCPVYLKKSCPMWLNLGDRN